MRLCLKLPLFLLMISGPLIADDVPETEQEKQARAKEVLDHMQNITVERIGGNTRQPVALIDHALLTYSDPARANDHGTVWAWGREGRPLAIVEVFRPSGQQQWVHAITLSSTDLIVAATSDGRQWSPKSTSIKFEKIPMVVKPSAREVSRLAQMKELARRFEACEYWDPDNSRFELRLLVQPIHRYRDPDKKIIDGAVFLLAHGTNPEIVMLMEAQGDTVETSEWHFAMTRLGSAELHASFDGKEVWLQQRAPGVVGNPTDAYWLFSTTRSTTK